MDRFDARRWRADGHPVVRNGCPDVAGFTLLELMITLTILVILITVVVPSMGGILAKTRVRSASSALYMAMVKARSEAVKRNNSVSVVSISCDWASGWQIKDVNNAVISQQGAIKGISIPCGGSTPTSVIYLGSGRIKSTGAVAFSIASSSSYAFAQCLTTNLSGMPFTKDGGC